VYFKYTNMSESTNDIIEIKYTIDETEYIKNINKEKFDENVDKNSILSDLLYPVQRKIYWTSLIKFHLKAIYKKFDF